MNRKKSKPMTNRFPVVGVGASAGGLEAFKELLGALPLNTGMAFVFVQHLDPTHESLISEILTRTTKLPVHEIEDGVHIEPNQVYIIPPNKDLTVKDGRLNLLVRKETNNQHLVIDSFFQSLAHDQKSRAIGVVLSGTASDGTQGLVAIKSEGGLAIAQNPKTAKYSGMPDSAIASGSVDLVLSPTEIAKELERISQHPYIAAACEEPSETQVKSDLDEEAEGPPGAALRKIFATLRAHTQVDFSNYKQTTIERRIERRMMVRKTESLEAYAKYLRDNPTEINALFSDILINVTEFFRDRESFTALRERVFPLLSKNKSNPSIRIWVPGCATGEEAYSLAISLSEFLRHSGTKRRIQIFATDISERSLQKARAGIYSTDIERNIGKERLKLYFERVQGGYKINKAIRDLCLFSKHDLASDPPFSKLDLVSCRNVLIYFAPALQKRVLPIFHYALNPGGILWLGRSESPGGSSKLFSPLEKVHKIYSKVNVPTPTLHFPLISQPLNLESTSRTTFEQTKSSGSFQKDAARIALSKYVPPSVVVSADMEILQFQGRTGLFLEPASGLPSNNLLKMAKQDLQNGIRKTFELAKKKNTAVRKENLGFVVEGQRREVSIEIVPANPLAPPKQRNFVIFFEEVQPSSVQGRSKVASKAKAKSGKKTSPDKQSLRIVQLEQELIANRELQQSMAEEFEGTQEELTSANEELQSTNEELQSTNEELETAKEELQSANEELTTVNDELQNRNTDLGILSSDLSNLLNSVEIPIVIIGNDLKIRRFTPKAEKTFNLISSDIGRPLSDIKPNFEIDLAHLASEVIESLTPQEKELKDRQGRWIRMQIRPYKTLDNRIDGAVISLMDIESLKQRISEGKKALDYLFSVAETVRYPIVILDGELKLQSANRAFWKHFKFPSEIEGKSFFSILKCDGADNHLSTEKMQRLLIETMRSGKEVEDIEVSCNSPSLGQRTLLLSGRSIQWMGETSQDPQALLLSLEDITERKRTELNLSAHREVLEMLAKGKDLEQVLRFLAHSMQSQSQGTFLVAIRLMVDDFEYVAAPDLPPSLQRAPGVDVASPEPIIVSDFSEESRWPKFAAEAISVGLRGCFITPILSIDQKILGTFTIYYRDPRNPSPADWQLVDVVTRTLAIAIERKHVEEKLTQVLKREQEARADAETANHTKDAFLATLSHELRTPLTSILSWAQLIQRQNFEPEKLKHAIKTIEQSAKTQGQLIDDLLDISRIQSGKIAINFTEVDPVDSIKKAVEAVRLIAEKKNVVIETEVNIQSERVWGDPERIQQIVWNLLTNAIKFSEPNSKVQIRVNTVENRQSQYLSIQVIDQGKGIPQKFLTKLFERFSQADSSSIRVHGGLGLGLAIVRDLVRLQGGSVWADSEGPGKGATFTVLLPLKMENSEKTEKQKTFEETKVQEESEMPDLKGLLVMVVEDDTKTLEVLIETLNSLGAKTIPCSSVAEALVAFDKLKPDILVSDIAMPGEDGYSLMNKIRKLDPSRGGQVLALALTAYASHEDIERAMFAGFQSHMAKPFDTLRFGRAVAELAKRLVKTTLNEPR